MFHHQSLPTWTCKSLSRTGFQEFLDVSVFPHVLWWANKHLLLNRRMEECHRHIPHPEVTTMTRRRSKRQNKTHRCTADTASRLHVPLTWLTTSLTRPTFFCEFRQLLFQTLFPSVRSSLNSSDTSNSNMRFDFWLTPTIHLCPFQFQPRVDV